MELKSRQSRRYIIKARRWLQHDSSRVARCSGVSRALSWMKFKWAGRREIACTPAVGWSRGGPMAGQWQQEEQEKPDHMTLSICGVSRGTASDACRVPQESISMECCAMHEEAKGDSTVVADARPQRLSGRLPPPATACHCLPP